MKWKGKNSESAKLIKVASLDFVEEDSEAPKVHEAYGSTLNILSNLFGAKSPQVKSLTDQRKQKVKYVNHEKTVWTIFYN